MFKALKICEGLKCSYDHAVKDVKNRIGMIHYRLGSLYHHSYRTLVSSYLTDFLTNIFTSLLVFVFVIFVLFLFSFISLLAPPPSHPLPFPISFTSSFLPHPSPPLSFTCPHVFLLFYSFFFSLCLSSFSSSFLSVSFVFCFLLLIDENNTRIIEKIPSFSSQHQIKISERKGILRTFTTTRRLII